MSAMFMTADFWFGAVILLAYQTAKFSELNSFESVLKNRFRAVAHLRVKDFVGRTPYFVTLGAFLGVTLIAFGLLCALSPQIIRGFALVQGIEGIEEYITSVPYPIYIAAAFMGLTQKAIPGFSKIGEVQRDIFHYWIGVPRRVIDTSNYFLNQLLADGRSEGDLDAIITRLTGDRWRRQIDDYADTVFFKQQVERLQLDEKAVLNEVLRGSAREKKNLIQQLVDAAALATVRENGGKSLPRLAADLGVTMPPQSRTPFRRVIGGVLIYLLGLTLLWFLIPMLHPLVFAIAGEEGSGYWPSKLPASGQYLLSNVVPILVALGVTLAVWASVGADEDQDEEGSARAKPTSVIQQLELYAPALLLSVITVTLFDFAQGLMDFGYFGAHYDGTALDFLLDMLPFYILHSMISLTICFVVLRYVDGDGRGFLKSWLIMLAAVAVVAAFYAKARLIYQFGNESGFDYISLIVMLNLVGGTLALAMGHALNRRQKVTTSEVEEQVPPSNLEPFLKES